MAKDNLLFLRRLHGRLHEWRIHKEKQFYYWKQFTFPLGKKVYVIGTPEHTNLGDSAIVLAQIDFVKKCNIEQKRIKEITFKEYTQYGYFIKKIINKNALICWHGGGNMGNQWIGEEYFRRDAMCDLKDNPMIIFPQTIFYTDSEEGKLEEEKSKEYYNSKSKLTIVAREKKSFDIMRDLYPDTEILLTPDIVLSSDSTLYGVKKSERKGALLCLRSDAEKKLTEEEHKVIECLLQNKYGTFEKTDMYSDIAVTKENRKEYVHKKMQEFAEAKVVITDRLHGMIFAAITETPCVVLSNYNQKVSGTYEWIKELPYIKYVNSVDEVKEALEQVILSENNVFDSGAWKDKYQPLKDTINKYM